MLSPRSWAGAGRAACPSARELAKKGTAAAADAASANWWTLMSIQPACPAGGPSHPNWR